MKKEKEKLDKENLSEKEVAKDKFEKDVKEEVVKEEPVEEKTPTTETTEEVQKVEEIIEKEPEIVPVPVKPKKKNTGLKVLGIIIPIIMILGIASLFVLPNIFLSGRKVIEREITAVFNEANRLINEYDKSMLKYDINKDSIGVEGTLTVDSNYKGKQYDLTKLKNYSIKYSGVVDKSKNEASFDLELDKKSASLLEISNYISGNKLMTSLGDVYNKTIITKLSSEIKDINISNFNDTEAIKKILAKTEKIMKDNINEKDITKGKEEKEINGKKGTYTKVEYKLNINELIKNIVNGYLKDDEVIELFADMLDIDKKDVKESLENVLDNFKETKDKQVITINVYLEGILNNVKAFEIIDSTGTFTTEIDGEIYKYRYVVDEETVITGEYDEKNNKVSIKTNNGITLKYEEAKDDTKKVEVEYKENKQSIKLNATVKNKVHKDYQENDSTIKVVYNSGKDEIEATLTNSMKIEKGAKPTKVTKNTTIDYEDINNIEYNRINRNLGEKLETLFKDLIPGYKKSSYNFSF